MRMTMMMMMMMRRRNDLAQHDDNGKDDDDDGDDYDSHVGSVEGADECFGWLDEGCVEVGVCKLECMV